jgi:hypothetical protein
MRSDQRRCSEETMNPSSANAFDGPSERGYASAPQGPTL